MLKHRVIPCVLLRNWQFVKSINFANFRTIGHYISTTRIYNSRNVDELIVLDIDATLHNQEINIEAIRDIADECFMPLTVGGGISSIDDIYKMLNAGADKITINSTALYNLDFIEHASSIFGSQCIVCSIDVKKINGVYGVFRENKFLDINPLDLAKKYQDNGAGEILLTSVDNDGLSCGYDIELMEIFKDKLEIPIILNGGMGKPIHAVEAIEKGADAIAASNIFHFSRYTPDDIKKELIKHDIQARIAITNHKNNI